jgi:hypothetical protein
MGIISQIESSGCKNMVGDHGQALGCYQLHKGVISDYNKAHKTALKHSDALDSVIGLKIASWYTGSEIPRLLRHYGKPDTIENRLTCWNRGIKAVLQGKRATNYIMKYKRIEAHNEYVKMQM